MKRFNNIVRCFAALVTLFALAIVVKAQNMRAELEDVGGYYRLSFVVNSTDVSDFTPPALPDFEKRSDLSTSTSRSFQLVNGHASHNESTTFTYILAARRSGKVTIGPASVRVNGKVVKSRPITVNVDATQSGGSHSSSAHGSTSSSQMPHDAQQSGTPVTQRDLFIDVTPSRTKIREQEAVLLTYRIHARAGVKLANTSLIRKPDFKDIISQEIPLPEKQIEMSDEQRNGAIYRTGTILQYVVFPQRSGNITIPAVTFNCTVVQQDNSLDMFELFLNSGNIVGVTVTREVKPITLNVEALPEPKPADFSGAVGNFSIKGSLLNPTIRTNDVATYRITLHGVGNIKLITPPSVVFPKDFDTYDAKTNENTKVTASGLNGEVTFDYTFVPRNVGTYEIPAVKFVYFDTEKGTYRTIETAPVKMNVAQGERSNSDVDHQLALLKSDIRVPHKLTGAASSQHPMLTWGSWQYFVLHAALIALFALMCILCRKYVKSLSDTTLQRRKGASGAAEKRLKTARTLLTGGDSRAFYAEISKALYGFISDKLNIPVAELSKERIAQLMIEKQVDGQLAEKLHKVLGECELAQFAPTTDDLRQTTYDEAAELIKTLKL